MGCKNRKFKFKFWKKNKETFFRNCSCLNHFFSQKISIVFKIFQVYSRKLENENIKNCKSSKYINPYCGRATSSYRPQFSMVRIGKNGKSVMCREPKAPAATGACVFSGSVCSYYIHTRDGYTPVLGKEHVLQQWQQQ